MKQGQYSQEQIYALLRRAETGQTSISAICREAGITETTFYRWRSKYGDMSVSDAQRLKELEYENARLKRLLAERDLEVDALKAYLTKSNPRPEQHDAVAFLRQHGLSERRACRLVGVNRASWQYRPRPDTNADLQAHLQQVAAKHPRWGVRKAYWIVRRERPTVNHKRIQRLWTQAGLQVRPRKRAVYKPPKPQPRLVTATRPGEIWSVDFVQDATETGGKLRILTVGDDFTRECLGVEVATTFPPPVFSAFWGDYWAAIRLQPTLKSDNGPEFIETHLTAWLSANGVQSAYTEPGHPWQNGVRESFHSRLRDELLDGSVFVSVADAQAQIEAWRILYNEVRPHQSLKGLTPHEYKAQWRQRPSLDTGD